MLKSALKLLIPIAIILYSSCIFAESRQKSYYYPVSPGSEDKLLESYNKSNKLNKNKRYRVFKEPKKPGRLKNSKLRFKPIKLTRRKRVIIDKSIYVFDELTIKARFIQPRLSFRHPLVRVNAILESMDNTGYQKIKKVRKPGFRRDKKRINQLK